MFRWNAHHARPLVVAHRGSSAAAPENTLAAFSRAVADGADAFELDVRLTSDRRVVVIHDRTLSRTAGAGGRVSDATAAAIRRLSAGAWFSEEFAGERVPLLEEALELSAGKVGVNIELKFDSRRDDPAPLVRRVAGIVGEFRRAECVLISSFHHRAVALQRSASPEIGSGILVYPPGVPATSGVGIALRTGAGWLIYSGGNIRKAFVSKAHRHGIRTMEYTVNTRARAARSARFGVDGVITNEPAEARRWMKGAGR